MWMILQQMVLKFFVPKFPFVLFELKSKTKYLIYLSSLISLPNVLICLKHFWHIEWELRNYVTDLHWYAYQASTHQRVVHFVCDYNSETLVYERGM